MKKPPHQRVQVSRLSPPDQPLRVRILGPTKVFATEDVDSVKLRLSDGLMQINRRYSSVIEKLKEGEIRLKLISPSASGKMEKKFSISSGWLLVSHNLCEILVRTCEELT